MNTLVVRMLTVVVVGAASSFSACCCDPEQCPGDGDGDGDGDATISFTAPRDNDVINEADDLDDSASNGIQFNVRVAYSDPSDPDNGVGAQLSLFTSQRTGSVPGTVEDDGVARFASFQLETDPDGPVEVTLRVTDGVVENEITVTVSDTRIKRCYIDSPSDGAQLTADVDGNTPGFQTPVTAHCDNVGDGNAIAFSVNGTEVGTDSLAGGMASSPGVTITDDGADNVISIVAQDENGDDIDGTQASVTVSVATQDCDPTITDPLDGAVIDATATDADGAPGFQYQVHVTTGDSTCEGETLSISVDGAAAVTAPLDNTGSAIVLVDLPDGAYDVTAVVTGARAGATATSSITVDTTAPTVEITSPSDGGVYGPSDDRDADLGNGISLQFTGTVSGLTGMADWSLSCTDGSTGSGTVAGDGTAFDVDLPNVPFDPTNTCTLTVTANDGVNSAMGVVTYAVSAVSIDITVPGDDDGNGYLIAGEDDDGATLAVMDAQVSVTTTFAAGSGPWTGTAQVWDLGADPNDPSDDLQVGADIDLGTLTDGAAVTFSLNVPYGERAYEVRVTLTDGVDTIGPAIELIRVDTVPPSYFFTEPQEGFHYGLADDSAGTAGYQRLFRLDSLTGIAPGRTIDFVDAGDGSTVIASCTVAAGICTANVTLGEGDYAVQAVAIDVAGNNTTSATRSFSIDLTAPEVGEIDIVVDADDNLVINAAEAGEGAGNVVSQVVVRLVNAADMVGRMLSLAINGSPPVAAVVVDNGGSIEATFNGSFPQGVQTLTVTGTDLSANALIGTTSVMVTVDTVSPTITLDCTDLLYLAADDNDGNPNTPLVVNLTAVTTGANGRPAQVLDGGNQVGSGTVAAGGVTFANVTLAEGTRSLTATVSDAAGNSATSPVCAPLVDTVPPNLTITSPASGSTFGPPGVGFEVPVSIEVTFTDLAPTQQICVVSDAEGQLDCALATASPLTFNVNFSVETIHSITAIATDVNGNPGTSPAITVDIITGNFSVLLTSPPLSAGLRVIGVAQDTSPPVGDGAQVVVIASVPNDTGAPPATATLTIEIDGGGTLSVMAPVMSGVVVFPAVTLTDGQTGTIEVFVDNGTKTGTTGQVNFEVDLGQPTVVWTAPASPFTLNQAGDLSGAPGGTFSATFAITNCEGGTFVVNNGVTNIYSAAVSSTAASGGNGSFTAQITAPEGDGQTLTATCTDLALNAGNGAITATVDVTPPAEPTLNLVVLDRRRGQIEVQFTEPGDNGNTGTATTVELLSRHTVAITDTDQGDVDLILVVFTPGGGGAAQAPATDDYIFDKTWHFGLFASDDVGNTSFSTASVALTTTQTAFTDPGEAGWAFAASRSRGNVGGDAHDDMIVSAVDSPFAANPGGFEVILGGNTPGDVTRTFVGPPASVPCGLGTCSVIELGWATNIIPDLNGDGYNEVAVVGYDPIRYNNELIHIYAGSATGIDAMDTPAAVWESPGFTETGYVSVGAGNLDNDGSGRDDTIMGSTYDDKVYVLLNTGAIPASGSIASVATRVLSTGGDARSVTGLADIDNDGYDEFAVCDRTNQTVYVVRGRSAAAWAVMDTDLNNLPAGDIYDLSPLAIAGICQDISSGDLDGDGDADLAVMYNDGLRVLRNDGGTFAAPVAWQQGAVAFPDYGSALAIADVNDDGIDDVTYVGNGNARLFFGRTGSPATRNAADVSYPLTTTGPTSVAGVDLLGDDGGLADLMYCHQGGAGTLTVRY